MDVFTIAFTLTMDETGARFVTALVDNHADPERQVDLHEVLGAIELGKNILLETYTTDEDDDD